MAQHPHTMSVNSTLAAVKSADWTSEKTFENMPSHGRIRRLRVWRTGGSANAVAARIMRSTGATTPPELLREVKYQDEIDCPLDLGYLGGSLDTVGYTGTVIIVAVRGDTGADTAVGIELELEA